jgi:cytochrome c peroxidase
MRNFRLGAASLLGALAALGSFGCRRAPEPERSHPLQAMTFLAATQTKDRVKSAQDKPNTERSANGLSADEAKEAARVALGRAIFFDASLSEPAGTSCSSCHDPAHAFSSQNGSTSGVPRGSRPTHLARRNAPSLLYLKYVPKFHYALEDDDATQPTPFGGLFWDGRVDTITELVRGPLLNPDEMNNRDGVSIAAKIRKAPYAGAFEREFGTSKDPKRTLTDIGRAVETFLTTDEMAPFSSKFDDFVRGRAKLSTLELLGMRLFKDPSKGGCVGCHHFNDTATDPSMSLFTDYGYDAIAVPRNPELPRRRSDLGLCERTDRQTPSSAHINCVHFRTPSLRNVAARTSFMHNGAFKSLRDVVAFYATRATDPKHWYKSGVKFEDVPAQYRDTVNVASIPYNRREGDVPALNDQEIDALVAFLQTLTDAPDRSLSSSRREGRTNTAANP